MTAPLALPPAGRTRPRNLVNISLLMVVTGGLVLFAALIGAYVQLSEVTTAWPPGSVNLDEYVGNMLAITAVMSAITVEWAWYSVKRDDQAQATWGLSVTALLGASFLVLLWDSARRIGFGPGSAKVGAFAIMYYALMVASGGLALLGLAALLLALARTVGRQMTPTHNEMLRAVAWYWDFVVICWLAVWATVWVFT
jgi:heme/copper-type cytochrome/quinol oxidase subunit 3